MHYLSIGLPGPTELITIVVVVLVVSVPSAVVAFVAWNYGRSPLAWFLISIVLTPVFALILLVAVGRIESE